MTIETRYNIGDRAWVMKWNKVHYLRIDAIEIRAKEAMVTEDGVLSILEYKYFYSFGDNDWYAEQDLFPTKEELIKSL